MSLIEDIKKLRTLTGAGMVDCKKALIESGNDMEKAKELIRQRGQAIAAKREDRSAAEGVAFGKAVDGFAAIVALKCETDFVSSNEKFIKLAKEILDKALEAKVKTMAELNDFSYDGQTVAEHITQLSGITGEKMELGDYKALEGAGLSVYNHFNNKLAVIAAFNKAGDPEVLKEVAMQIATSNPIACTREEVPQSVIDEETKVAIEKTKEEQVEKAVNNALSKAGINPNLVDSDDHISSNLAKGWLTQEQADKAQEIKKTVAAEKAANLPEAMIQNITKGRLNKFFSQNVLTEQPYEAEPQLKLTIGQYLAKNDADLKVIAFQRVNLNAD